MHKLRELLPMMAKRRANVLTSRIEQHEIGCGKDQVP